MNLDEYQLLAEGLTQKDDSFRELMSSFGYTTDMYDDLASTKNTLNHAMLGIHPIYRREVEIAGWLDKENEQLVLLTYKGETITPFNELDPSYLAFVTNQQRITNVTDSLPLSSVALRVAEAATSKEASPDLSTMDLSVPEIHLTSQKLLERAFANEMVLLSQLDTFIKKNGLEAGFATNKDALIQQVGTKAFDFSFKQSVDDLSKDVTRVHDDQSQEV